MACVTSSYPQYFPPPSLATVKPLIPGRVPRAQSSDSPALPPRVSRSNTEIQRISNQERPIVPRRGTRNGTSVSKPMKLCEFVSAYSDRLPVNIVAQTGYYGANSNLQISKGEKLHVHLTRTTDVVIAANDLQRRETYSIPLNSSCQFSIIYNPHENMSEATKGYVFKGVKQLARADSLPKVVCALTAWKRGKITVDVNEVLVVKNTNDRNELQVFSVTCSQSKWLPFDCQSKFTTYPQLIPMYLLDIVSNVSEAFPCQVLMQAAEGMRELLGSSHLVLLNATSETTLHCSYPGTNDRLDLPVDLPTVTVTICEDEDETEKFQLYESTINIISTYNPAYVSCCRDDVSKNMYETQSKIYASIRKGYESAGVYINVSQALLRQSKAGVRQDATGKKQFKQSTSYEATSTYVSRRDDVPADNVVDQMQRTNRSFLASLSEDMVSPIQLPCSSTHCSCTDSSNLKHFLYFTLYFKTIRCNFLLFRASN